MSTWLGSTWRTTSYTQSQTQTHTYTHTERERETHTHTQSFHRTTKRCHCVICLFSSSLILYQSGARSLLVARAKRGFPAYRLTQRKEKKNLLCEFLDRSLGVSDARNSYHNRRCALIHKEKEVLRQPTVGRTSISFLCALEIDRSLAFPLLFSSLLSPPRAHRRATQ